MPKRHRPGSSWRVLVHDYLGRGQTGQSHDINSDQFGPTEFDEVVVDSWLHIEQMDSRLWWMRIGDVNVNVEIGKDGEATRVTFEGDGGCVVREVSSGYYEAQKGDSGL